MIEEDKIAFTKRRAELIAILAKPTLPPLERVRIQSELSVLNAQIKALNTTNAAQLKAAADRRRAAGMVEFQAHSARAQANAGLRPSVSTFQHHYSDDLACPACGTDSTVGCIAASSDDDPGQTEAIDSWIDAVLLRHDIDFSRDAKGKLMVTNDPRRRAPMEPNLATAIELLVTGVYAAARGQELPDLPSPPKTAAKPTKPTPAPKSKKR